MKEIVVGIDFSNSSIQALNYALKIAEHCGCNMKLIYVSKQRDKDYRLIKDEKGMKTNITDNFKNLIKEKENEGRLKGTIDFKILHGKIWDEITNQAKYTDADLIITGAHGMSGFEELWVGNNAMKIIAHSEKPVLCVKKNYKIKIPVIEKIVLPIDHTKATLRKIPFTIQLAQLFKAQINVLSFYNSKIKNSEEVVDQNTRKAMEVVAGSGLRYINEKKTSDNLAKATIEYALKRNGDLISIMIGQESSPNSILISNDAQQIINQSIVPVLSFRSGALLQPTAYS